MENSIGSENCYHDLEWIVRKIKIVIRIEGGVVSDVYANAPVDVQIFDVDDISDEQAMEQSKKTMDVDELWSVVTADLMRVY